MLRPEDKEPNLGPFDFYIESFFELSTCRQIGMALGPIPFTTILEYCKIFEVEEFTDFLYFMRRLDNIFLSRKKDNGDNKHTRDKKG
jgi:hypothetical protein